MAGSTGTGVPTGGSDAALNLDGGADVLLAPVRGLDTRRSMPKELFEKRPWVFTLKFGFALALIVLGAAVIAAGLGIAATVAAIVVIGLMFGHLVELQHECLHEHAYRSRKLNRWVGVACGLFMFSSYSHYKYDHLRHHAFLGTPKNKEFFNYRFRNLDSVPGFLYAAFHLGRYKDVVLNIVRSVFGRPLPGVRSEVEARKIRAEYRVYAAAVVVAVAVSVALGTPLLVFAWLIPTLLVAEATHFMIEMPEHFGLNTQTDPNVLSNTRTIKATAFAQWFTNGNNLHTAHHFHQGVPMVNVARLHRLTEPQIEVVEESYPSFYLKVLRGEIRQDLDVNCMTR
jgi:fatty acid desaturase